MVPYPALLSFLLFFTLSVTAQPAIRFADGPWEEVLARASQLDRPIFVYAYSPGCRYCRQMEREVFPDPGVAAHYNATFINYRIDIEDEGAGAALAEQYGIEAFPTYLYLDPGGKPLHQSAAAKPPEEFLADARAAFDPDRALFSLMRRYAAGDRDPDLLYAFADALNGYRHPDSPQQQVIDAYLATQSPEQLASERNLRFIFSLYPDFGTPAADYLLAHRDRFVPLFGEEEVRYLTEKIVRNAASAAGRAGDEATLEALRASARRHFPDGDRVRALAEITYLQGAGDWPAYARATQVYAAGVGADDLATLYETASYLNAFADDPDLYVAAAQLMLRVTEQRPTVDYLTRYAELLSKSGDQPGAEAAARRAVAAAERAGEPADRARELLAEW